MHQLKKYSFLLVVVVLLALVGASTALAQQIITTPNPLFFTQFGSELPLSRKLSVSCAFCGVQLSDVTATAAVTTPPGGNWLQVSPSAGTFNTPATLTVSVNPTGLQGGTYSGIITIASSAATNSPQSVSVSLEVSLTDPGPTILVSQSSLSFAHQIGTELPAASNLQVSCLCFRGGSRLLLRPRPQ